jgi:hypothetical protein
MSITPSPGRDHLEGQVRILQSELLALHASLARTASGAIVHRVDNCLQVAQSALAIAELEHTPEREEALCYALARALIRLREARALLKRGQTRRAA